MKFFTQVLFFVMLMSHHLLYGQCELNPAIPVDTVFVKETGSGIKDGSSWNNALEGKFLSQYLREKVEDGTVIFISEGTYYPVNLECDTASDKRGYTFLLNKSIIMRGGYSNMSVNKDLSDRNMSDYITRFSGEFQQDGTQTNNSYHIITIQDNAEPLLEGFYISDGYANSNPSVNNSENGGGILNFGGNANITLLSHLIIENNAANFGGGAYFNTNYATLLGNCIFRNNRTLNGYGGAAIFAWGNFGLLNCEVTHNTNGAAIVSWQGDMSFRNTTISYNEKQGIYGDPGNLTDSVWINVTGCTIANNGLEGINMRNPSQTRDYVTINIDNSLIINNKNDPANHQTSNIDFNDKYPVDTVNISYSVTGNIKYEADLYTSYTLPLLVEIDSLKNNGGFGNTQALLDVCNNPAVNSGNPDLFENPLSYNDQRGIPRNRPFPCLGAYDGIVLGYTTTWTGNAGTTDWNDPGNWSDSIPGICSSVTIPQNGVKYPAIGETTNAICDSVYFENGAEIEGITYLNYTAARLDLQLDTNRWYMIAPPFRDMYSGDYFTTQTIKRRSPSVYLMQYQTQNPERPEIEVIAGDWSYPFNTMDVSLHSGYAVWIDNENIPQQSFTFEFPKDSVIYQYYDRQGHIIGNTGNLTRDNKSRFIFENAEKSSEGFKWPVDDTYETFLTGNPFISHLDFSQLYSANNDKIEPVYYVWSGGSFDANIPGNWSDMPNEIAPMQSFILKKVSATSTFDFLQINPGMSVSASGNNLRNDHPLQDILNIELYQDDKYQSRVTFRYDPAAGEAYDSRKDAWTLFSNSYQVAPVIYTLLDGKAASIKTTGNLSKAMDLGIKSKKTGTLSIKITGLDDFNTSFSCFILDKQTGKMQNMRENPEFIFENDPEKAENRLALLFSPTNSTSIDNIPIHDTIRLYQENKQTYISAPDHDPIHRICIYNLQGQILADYNNMEQIKFIFPENLPQGILIVKITTQQTRQSIKFLN